MRNENKSNQNTGVKQYDWNHHCLNFECGYIWDSEDLNQSCPKCGSEERETLCHIPEFEGLDCSYPAEWQKALELHSEIEAGDRREITEERLEELYADMLDECCPSFKCAGIEYAASATLKRVDEVAYDLGMSEYVDREWEEHPFRSGYYISKQ